MSEKICTNPAVESIISRAIVERFSAKFLEHLSVDVALVGAGPSALVAARYLAEAGVRCALFERS